MSSRLSQANNNIRYYVFIRIFAKRVFLPLTAIYFMDRAGFSLIEIGYLSAFFSLIQLVAEVPTGYFADRIGRILSLRIGASLALMATLTYVLTTNKLLIVLGVMCEALGYSFMGGAGEALIHDSLVVKNATDQYTKIMSRNMSISLLFNAILITLVPLTYQIDPRLPFLIGTLAYGLLLFFTFQLTELFPHHPVVKLRLSSPSWQFLITHKSMLAFGLTFGVISALYTALVDSFNVALKTYGANPAHIGYIYGLASLLGFLIGPTVHHLKRLRIPTYTTLDALLIALVYFAASVQNLHFLWAVMIISIAFWRYRRILYQDFLLQLYPHSYKATLISTLNNLEQINAIWLPVVITHVIAATSFNQGFLTFAILALTLTPLFRYATARFFQKLL